MVLCDQLIYNVPGTLTISWSNKYATFTWSQSGIQSAVEESGVDPDDYFIYFSSILLYSNSLSDFPYMEKLTNSILKNVTVVSGDTTLDLVTAGFLASMSYSSGEGTMTCSIPRNGISKYDLAYIESGFYYGNYSCFIGIYTLLFCFGYLTPQEIYALKSSTATSESSE